MRIRLHKLSDERHALEIVRDSGARERMECETRSYLVHDLLHYAVEREAGTSRGFWGNLAAGKTLLDMNDRSGQAMAAQAPELMLIEQTVGALTGAVKGRSAAQMAAALRAYAEAQGAQLPEWLNEPFILAVQERMRRLLGHWKATAFGAVMELDWPDGP